MAWIGYVYAFLSFASVHAQITISFNDWTAVGVEKETDLAYRTIDKVRDETKEMYDYVMNIEPNASSTYFSSKKEIFDNTYRDLNAVAELAQKAGFFTCAGKARIDASTIVVKYHIQVNTNNDIFIVILYKFKPPMIVAKNIFSVYNQNVDNLLFRGCDNPVNRLFPNWVSNCYKVIMDGVKNKYETVVRLMDPLYRDYPATRKAFADYHANINRIVAEAASETVKAVEEAKRCANLDKKPPVQVKLVEIAALNAATSEYLKTNTSFLETSINGLQSKLNTAKESVNANVTAAVQPFLSIGKYLKQFGLTGEQNVNLNKELNTAVENTGKKINSLIADKIQTLQRHLIDVRSVAARYKLDFSYVSESNLTNLCVPKDVKEQIAREEDIKTCLSHLFVKFSNAVQEAKSAINKKVSELNSIGNDVTNTQVNINAEIDNAVEKLKLDLTMLLKSYGYNPSLFLQIVEKHFTLPVFRNIKNQIDIKANLGKIRLTLDSVKANLDFEVESAVGQLSETIKIIKILNPKYDLSALQSAHLKWKTDLNNKINGFLDGKHNNAVSVTAPALNYDLDLELNSLLRSGVKCSPDLVQLVICLEPLTVKFENALTKSTPLSLNILTDTNLLIRKLPDEIKQFTESAFNDAKRQVKILSLDALNSANPGTDYIRDTIIQCQNDKDRIKTEAQTSMSAANDFYLNNRITLDRFKLDVEYVLRDLRLAYEKNYKLVPNQLTPWSVKKSEIERKTNTYFDNMKSKIGIYLDGSIAQNLKIILNRTCQDLIVFTKELVNSNCGKETNQSIFNACIRDIYKKYTLSLNTAENQLKVIANDIKSVFPAGLKFVENLQAKELQIAEQEVKSEIEKIQHKIEDSKDVTNNNAISSFVNQCLQGTNTRINTEILPKTNQTIQTTTAFKVELASLRTLDSWILDTLSTWWSTIDFTFKLSSRNAAKLNAEKERFNKYRTEIINRVKSNIQKYLNNITQIETETNTITNEMQSINFNSLNQTCAPVYQSKFQQCINEQCTKVNNNIDLSVKKINDLYNIILNLKSSAKTSIASEIKKAEDLGKVESEKIIKEYNVTASQIITTALRDFAKFNVTPFTQIVQNIRVTANNLQEYALYTNKSANDMFSRITNSLHLHVYAASIVCPKRSTKNESDSGLSRIQNTMNILYALFPNVSSYVLSQLQLANQLNTTLQSEILKLSSVGQSCDNKDLYKLVECIGKEADTFGEYFENATTKFENNRAESLEQYKKRTAQLDTWREINVNQEYAKLKRELQPIPENVYLECNVTKDKLLDFALINMNNRKNQFSSSIPSTVQNIVATGNSVLATSYSGIVNMNQLLQEPVKFTRAAISDVLASKNASQITAQVKLEPDRLVGVGVQQSDKFILDLYATARQSIQLAQSLQVQADELHKNTNRGAVEIACYNSQSEYPISHFVVCNNEYIYQYEVKLKNIHKQLDQALQNLQNIKQNGRQLIVNNANEIAADIKTQSATYAVYLYFTAGLARPTYLNPFVKDGCLLRLNGDPRNTCIVFS